MKYITCDKCGKRIEHYYHVKIIVEEKNHMPEPVVTEYQKYPFLATTGTFALVSQHVLEINLDLCGKCKDEVMKEPIEKIKEEYK